jgi:hypothetical protein
MEEKNLSESGGGNLGDGVWRWFNIAVVACILALSVLLGVLNNLRVSEERRVKWFGDSANQADAAAGKEML